MKAALVIPSAEGGTIEMHDVSVPTPTDGQVLVRVHASAINRAEIARRKGQYHRPGIDSMAPIASGSEFAGEVVAIGSGVTSHTSGDRVMGRCPSGGHAEFVAVDARAAIPIPHSMSFEEAATIPNVFITAHDAIVTNGGLQRGETFLVNAASSGVGIAALQIARLLGANPVIGSSSSPAKLERMAEHGLTAAIDTSSEDLVQRIQDITSGRGVDLLIDNVGGEVLAENLKAMAILGRMVSVGRLGTTTGPLNLDQLAYKRVKLIGVTFRTRSGDEALECSRRFAEDLMPAFADGRLRGVVDRVFALDELLAAHDYMETNAHIGKIVIKIA